MDIIDELHKYMQQQKDVADELGVTREYLNHILKRKSEPGRAFVVKANNWLAKQKETAPEPPCA